VLVPISPVLVPASPVLVPASPVLVPASPVLDAPVSVCPCVPEFDELPELSDPPVLAPVVTPPVVGSPVVAPLLAPVSLVLLAVLPGSPPQAATSKQARTKP